MRELPGGQAEQAVESIIRATDGTLADDTAEKRIQQRTDIGPTEKLNLVKVEARSRHLSGNLGENREELPRDRSVGSAASPSEPHQTLVYLPTIDTAVYEQPK